MIYQPVKRSIIGFTALLALVCTGLYGTVLAEESGAHGRHFELSLGYESRYIEEGENELDHGGIVKQVVELGQQTEFGDFHVELEFIQALSVDFNEVEVGVGYSKGLGDLTTSLSWVRIREDEDEEGKEYDSEWAIGFSYGGWEYATPSVEYVYSTEANGGLLVLAVESEFEVAGQTLVPYLLADIDYDYVSEEYDGLNHIEAGVAWEVPLPKVDMTIHAAYSMAQENLRREDEDKNYLWGGINFSL